MGVARLVGGVERAVHVLHGGEPRLERHRQLECLADVAHVEARLHAHRGRRKPVLGEAGARPRGELAEEPLQLGELELRRPRHACAHLVVTHVGHQEPERREVARHRRHHHARHPELGGDEGGVERTRAAVGEEREGARVVSPHDGDLLDGARHLHDGQLHDPVRQQHRVDPQRAGQTRDGRPRAPGIEPDLAAERLDGAEPPEDDVGVGDSGLLAAAPVAGRARRRACRPWAHVEEAAGAEPRDAAAAGADAVDLELQHLVRQRAHAPLGGHGELPVAHETHVGAGAAHVVGDEVRVPGGRRHVRGADHAGGGPRQHRVDREVDDALGRQRPAVRRHDRERPTVASLREAGGDGREVAPHARGDVDVEDGGGEALVLAVLGQHLRRGGHEHFRQRRRDRRLGAPLVVVVGVGVQVADGHRLHAGRPQRLHDALQLLGRRCAEHGAVEERALVHLEAEPTGHEPGRARRLDVVEHHAVAAADLQHVAEAPRGDHGRPRPAALERGVGGHRGAVGDPLHAVELDGEAADARHHALGVVARRRRRFFQPDGARRLVVEHEVGEGAAHVDAEPEHGVSAPGTSAARRGCEGDRPPAPTARPRRSSARARARPAPPPRRRSARRAGW